MTCNDCFLKHSSYCQKERGETCYKLVEYEEKKLKGQCKICLRRKRCDRAKSYEEITDCPAYKVSKNRRPRNGNE